MLDYPILLDENIKKYYIGSKIKKSKNDKIIHKNNILNIISEGIPTIDHINDPYYEKIAFLYSKYRDSNKIIFHKKYQVISDFLNDYELYEYYVSKYKFDIDNINLIENISFNKFYNLILLNKYKNIYIYIILILLLLNFLLTLCLYTNFTISLFVSLVLFFSNIIIMIISSRYTYTNINIIIILFKIITVLCILSIILILFSFLLIIYNILVINLAIIIFILNLYLINYCIINSNLLICYINKNWYPNKFEYYKSLFV